MSNQNILSIQIYQSPAVQQYQQTQMDQAKQVADKPQEKVENADKNELLGEMDECGERAEYHNLVDILFVIDATGSMSWCISQMKKTVCKIMKKFSDKQYNIKFAIQLYRDHPPQQYSYIEKHFDLRNQDDIITVIDKECDVAGGGDTPEAALDGLVNGLKKTSWRVSTDGKTKSKRFLFHGCDAPPHGKQYGCTSSDKTWTEKGCPCGFTRQDVKALLIEHNVDYSLIKCGKQVDTMATLFKECFAEKFKRELQIKQEAYRGGGRIGKRGGGLQRKLSVEYMEQIQRQEAGSEASGSEYEQQGQDFSDGAHSDIAQDHVAHLCVDQVDKAKIMQQKECAPKKSFFDSIKEVFSSKQSKEKAIHIKAPPPVAVEKKKVKKLKKKVVKAEKKKQQQNCEDNSSDDQKGGKPRSMASLVLSDIQDGIDNYFEEPKKVQKVTKDI